MLSGDEEVTIRTLAQSGRGVVRRGRRDIDCLVRFLGDVDSGALGGPGAEDEATAVDALPGLAMAALGGLYDTLGLCLAGQVSVGNAALGGFPGLDRVCLGWRVVVAGTLLAWLLAVLAIPLRWSAPRAMAGEPPGLFRGCGALLALLTSR